MPAESVAWYEDAIKQNSSFQQIKIVEENHNAYLKMKERAEAAETRLREMRDDG